MSSVPRIPGTLLATGVHFSTAKAAPSVAVRAKSIGSAGKGGIGNYHFKMAKTNAELAKALDVSVQAQFDWLSGGLDAQVDFFKGFNQSTFSLYVVIRYVVELAEIVLNDLDITEEARKYFEDKGEEAFKQTYGDCFVKGITPAVELYGVLDFQVSSQSEVEKLSTSLHLDGMFAEISADVEKKLKSTRDKSNLTISIFQKGGIVPSDVVDLEGLKAACNKLRDAATSFQLPDFNDPRFKSNGYVDLAAVDYAISNMEPWLSNITLTNYPVISEIQPAARQDILAEMAEIMFQYEAYKRECDLAKRRKEVFASIPQNITQLKLDVETASRQLRSQARECASNSSECKIDGHPVKTILDEANWPVRRIGIPIRILAKDYEWFDTDIKVTKGQRLLITQTGGLWRSGQAAQTDANGYQGTTELARIDRETRGAGYTPVVDRFPLGALVGRIRKSDQTFSEFFVGSEFDGKVSDSGILELIYNDDMEIDGQLKNGYWDNDGCASLYIYNLDELEPSGETMFKRELEQFLISAKAG